MRARSVTCKNCGGRTRIHQGQQEAACMHCGTPVRISDAALEEQARARMFPPMTPLRLGMKAQYRGRDYELTGRQVFRQIDEGVTYQWEEFVLIAPDGHLLYLEYDEGKWKVSEPFVPENPMDGQQLAAVSTGGVLRLDGHGALITDVGVMTVVHVEGEFPWLAVVGKQAQFIDASAGLWNYSIERTDDAIEYYKGQFLDERQVFVMFGLHHLVAALDRRLTVLKSRRSFGALLTGLGLLAMIVWIFALAGGGGQPVPNGSGSITIDRGRAVNPGAAPGGPQDTVNEGVRFGPIPLTSTDRVYRLEIRGQMREQSNWVAAVLEDESELELIPVDKDMWDQSGRDSDGAWHESDLHRATHFVIKKPGNYFVRMYAEPGETYQGSGGTGQASFLLKQKVLYSSYMGWLALLSIILGIIWLLAGAPSTTKAVWEGLKASGEDD